MKKNNGSAMVLALGLLMIMTISLSAFLALFHATFNYSQRQQDRHVCLHIAEAGLDKALAEVRSGNLAYPGEADTPIGAGAFTVKVTKDSESYVFESLGRLLDRPSAKPVRLREQVRLDSQGRIQSLNWQEVTRNE